MNYDYAIGVDLGGTNIRVGLVKGTELVKYASSKTPQGENVEKEVIDSIVNTIAEVFEEGVSGIGIGIPGLFDNTTGVIHSIVNIKSLTKVPIRDILLQHFGVPVFINNDVNCFALGEKYFGAGVKFDNLVGLSIGTGMGAGIITGGELLKDTNGGSGEFGEVPYLDSNFENYCSGQFFIDKYNISGEEMFKRATEGDKIAVKAFEELGVHLGKVIKLIVLAFDPQIIVLGGAVSKSNKFFHKAMIEEIRKNFSFQESINKLKIEYSQEKYSPILGATKLISHQSVSVI
jgi:glucokinase